MTVTTFNTVNDGVNPFTAEGPVVAGSGVIVPQFRLGHVAYGDAEAEFVYCKYTSVANQVLSPGLCFTVDDDYTATIASTSTTLKGTKVMVCCVGMGLNGQSVTTVTGSVYYLWLARSGQIPVAYTTSAGVGSQGEFTATAGALAFQTTLTGGTTRAATMISQTKATGGTFVGTTVNGSPIVTLAPGQLTLESGPAWIGSTVTGTGIPASTTVSALQFRGTSIVGLTLSANATASGSPTITASLITQARVQWPYTT